MFLQKGFYKKGGQISGKRIKLEEYSNIKIAFFHLTDLMLPFFPEEVNNVTVKVGQNAVLKCKVENLNSYKVRLTIFIPW